MVIDVVGRAHLGDDALEHDDDLVRQAHGLRLVMGDIDRGDAHPALDAADLRAHRHAQLGVEVGKRLVKQQNARFHHQGAGQSDALLLPTGELVGHAGFHAGHLDQIQNVHHLVPDGLLGEVAQLQPVGHVVKHIVVGEQRVALEHHRGIAFIGRQAVDGLAAQIDLTLVGAFKARDHAQRGRLAAARRAKQRHKAARGDVQVHILHGVEGLGCLGVHVYFGDMLQLDAFLIRHWRWPPSLACWYRSI
ncbi:hypothetical protein SDC9_145395 [bioreactor metagenome]|uniref:Uncharacterized protein n=1 Tax=bioreactor metagenome TaxID=1076179 RepID=A0A645E9V8_9ZZZZ